MGVPPPVPKVSYFNGTLHGIMMQQCSKALKVATKPLNILVNFSYFTKGTNESEKLFLITYLWKY